MAKGHFNSILRGKLGNSVMYRNSNSNNGDKQGSRAYVATIANPQTQAQAAQRMRIPVAQNFYKGFADILDHSFEGVKYGGRSRSKFLQLAQQADPLNVIPYVDKGTKVFLPAEFLMSTGSVNVALGALSFSAEDYMDPGYEKRAAIDSLGGFDWGDYSTFGEYSQGLIEACPGLRDGDEITCACVFNKNGYYLPLHRYFVLDTHSLARYVEVLGPAGVALSTDGIISFGRNDNGMWRAESLGDCVAAAVIISRHPSRTSRTWLRSTSRLALSPDFKAMWCTDSRYTEAKKTYMKQTAVTDSDWLLNQAENDDTEQEEPFTLIRVKMMFLQSIPTDPENGGDVCVVDTNRGTYILVMKLADYDTTGVVDYCVIREGNIINAVDDSIERSAYTAMGYKTLIGSDYVDALAALGYTWSGEVE